MKTIPVEEWNGSAWVEVGRTFDTAKDFLIDETNLDGELCRMGQLMVEYGSTWADLKAQVARHDEEQEAFYAHKALGVRSSKEKITADAVKETLKSDQEYRSFLLRTQRSEKFMLQVEVWYKSLLGKKDCLIALAYKHRQEIKAMGGSM